MLNIKFLFSIILSILCHYVSGQGIEFFNGGYDAALKKAAEEKKTVFIDFFAEWCGPCKLMSETVFTDTSVGDYYNKNFVCIKINAETPENRSIVKRYHVTGYPTLAYVNAEGKKILIETGVLSVERFLKIGKIATGEELGFEDLYKKYKSNKDLGVLQHLLIEAPGFLETQEGIESDKWTSRIEKLYREYIEKKIGPDFINKTDYQIMTAYHRHNKDNDPLVEFVLKNMDAYLSNVGKAAAYFVIEHNASVMERLAKAGKSEYKNYIERIKKELKPAYSILPSTDIDPYEKAKYYYEAIYTLYHKKDVNTYIKLANRYIEFMGENMTGATYGEFAQNLYYATSSSLSRENHEQAIAWIHEALKFKDMPITDKINYFTMLGDSHKALGELKKAKEYYNQAYVICFEMDSKMEMMKMQIQYVIKMKISELELLEK